MLATNAVSSQHLQPCDLTLDRAELARQLRVLILHHQVNLATEEALIAMRWQSLICPRVISMCWVNACLVHCSMLLPSHQTEQCKEAIDLLHDELVLDLALNLLCSQYCY